MEDKVFSVFDFLRFPLIVGVVIIHCYSERVDVSLIDWTNPSLDLFGLAFRIGVAHVLCCLAVPLFFLFSGYLFFANLENWDFQRYREKLKRRAKTILLPFLLWNTIAIFLALIWHAIHNGAAGIHDFLIQNGGLRLYWNCRVWDVQRLSLFGEATLASAPYLIPLWYLRDLMVMFLVSPVLGLFLKKAKWIGALIITTLYCSNFSYGVGAFCLEPDTVMWFSAGAFLKIHKIDFLESIKRAFVPLLVIFLVLWGVCTRFDGHLTETGRMLFPFYDIVGCLVLLNLSRICVEKGMSIPKWITGSTVFIYCFHTLPVAGPIIITKKILECASLSQNSMTFFFLSPIIVIIISLAAFQTLRILLPGICSALVGARR